jgi:hypothetical protein
MEEGIEREVGEKTAKMFSFQTHATEDPLSVVQMLKKELLKKYQTTLGINEYYNTPNLIFSNSFRADISPIHFLSPLFLFH